MHSRIIVLKPRKNSSVDIDEDTLYEWMSGNGSGCDYVDHDLSDDDKADSFMELKPYGSIVGNMIKLSSAKLKKHHMSRIETIKKAAADLTFDNYVDWLGAWRLKNVVEPAYTYIYTDYAGLENIDEFLRRCTRDHCWTWHLDDVYDWHC